MHFRRCTSVLAMPAALLTMGAFVTNAFGADAACRTSPYRSARTRIIAHASGTYFGPPNTVEMMRAAKQAGADILDADVRTTKDGVLVASHDDEIRVDATTTVSIAHTNYADLRRINLGATWVGPNGNHPLANQQVSVPTVDAILRAFPDNTVSLEFKTTGGEATMCNLLRKLGRTKNVYLGSAGDAAIDRFKPLCPEVTTTVTDAMVPIFLKAQADHMPWCAPVPIGQPPLRQGAFLLTKASVDWEHAHGLAVFTWTADDKPTLEHVATLGVDAVYTARPDIARAVFSKRP